MLKNSRCFEKNFEAKAKTRISENSPASHCQALVLYKTAEHGGTFMRHTGKIFYVFIIFAFFICGCSGLQPAGKKIVCHYSLEYDPVKIPVEKQIPAVIRVEHFQVSPLYDSNKIIYRDETFKREAYAYHKWWAKPGDMVTYFLARDMKAFGGFKAVFSLDRSLSASYVLEGVVDEFFEWDESASWEAVLSLSITLLAENEPNISKKILLQKKYDIRETCTQKNPKALAQAMSKAMSAVSEKIIRDVYDRLATGH